MERGTSSTPPPRDGTPMWVWLIPLVLVVIVLMWFILTRGEPRSPTFDLGEPAPQVDEPAAPDVQIDIQTPDPPPVVDPSPSPTPAPAPEPTPEPTEPAPPDGL